MAEPEWVSERVSGRVASGRHVVSAATTTYWRMPLTSSRIIRPGICSASHSVPSAIGSPGEKSLRSSTMYLNG